MPLPCKGPLLKSDSISFQGGEQVQEGGKKKGWSGECSLQSQRVLRPMDTVSSPSVGSGEALDATLNLGAVNISVSRVTSRQEAVSPPLQSPY